MALKKQFKTESGIEASYWSIVAVNNFDKITKNATVTVGLWKSSEDKKKEGYSPITVKTFHLILDENKEGIIYKNVYESLVNMPSIVKKIPEIIDFNGFKQIIQNEEVTPAFFNGAESI